jgi:hypothetical protein
MLKPSILLLVEYQQRQVVVYTSATGFGWLRPALLVPRFTLHRLVLIVIPMEYFILLPKPNFVTPIQLSATISSFSKKQWLLKNCPEIIVEK